MDVPFHSSGAMSRAHYAIVHKVESASTVQSGDQHLFLEINSIQGQLSHPKLQLSHCKECLVLLLYCSMSVSPGFLAQDAFYFAFPRAIHLAEAGRKIDDKRIGYLFCSEMMPINHELRLMLVNTLRKDLESDEVPRICLALDNLITTPNEDVIPAVQSRLSVLLSNEHSHVRRRALLAIRTLSNHNPELLTRLHGTVIRMLGDPDETVVKSALTVTTWMSKDAAITPKVRTTVNKILKSESYIGELSQSFITKLLSCLDAVGLVETNIPLLLDILQTSSSVRSIKPLLKVMILQIFRLLSQAKQDQLASMEKSRNMSSVRCIRDFLILNNPNDLYFFVSCLECIDVTIWAGTTSESPAVLEERHFGRIMQLLDSLDLTIFRKVLIIVNRVDPTILDLKTKQLKTQGLDLTRTTRILEIVSARFAHDGATYAFEVLKLFEQIEEATKSPQVVNSIVETVLTTIQSSSNKQFGTAATSHFISVLVNQDHGVGPNALVIISALATEFAGSLPVEPPELLSGFAIKLRDCIPAIQETCLIAMLRVSADCDQVPSDVIDIVKTITSTARRAVRARGNDFLEYLHKKDVLTKIVQEASSSSLPHFLMALENRQGMGPRSSSTAGSLHVVSPFRASGPALKYTPYDPPEIIPRLRTRRPSSSQSSHSGLSDPGQVSLPMTPGNLTLAAGLELEMMTNQLPSLVDAARSSERSDLQPCRMDLITLDTPDWADSDIVTSTEEPMSNCDDFEDIWNSFDASCDLRGWCSASIDDVVRRLQCVEHRLAVTAAELPPFIGELKITMMAHTAASSSRTLIRLRETEEDSCLWRLRCEDNGFRTHVQTLLS